MNKLSPAPNPPEVLVSELRRMIADARRQAAIAVNVGLTVLYWRLGDRIRREVLGSERAGYGEQIVATPSHRLAVLPVACRGCSQTVTMQIENKCFIMQG